MPYVLLRQDMNPDVWSARASDALDFSEFLAGKAAAPAEEPVRIELAEESETRSDFLEFPYFIVSDAMRNALAEYGVDNIDFFSTVLAKAGSIEVHDGYWLGNIRGSVRCVDAERSTFKQLSGSKRILRAFHVDEAATGGAPLFRLGENRQLVLVSWGLRDHLSTAGLTGIYFQPTDEYDGEPASSFWES